MNWFNNLKLNYKFGVVLLLFGLGLVIFAVNSYKTIQQVQINGDLYKEIIKGKDLIADILPPPDYIVETHLICFQLINEQNQSVRNELISKSKLLREEFETRHKYWRSELSESPMKQDMISNSYKPAVEYFELRDSKFFPLIQNNQNEEAKTLLLTLMKEKYDTHRKYIDQVVKYANEYNANTEISATEIISSKTLYLVLTAAGILVIISVIVTFITRKISKHVDGLALAAEKIASGDVNVYVKADTNDEIGHLERSFSKMIENIKESSSIAEKIAQGNLDLNIKPKSDKDILSISLNKVAENINRLVSDVNSLSKSAIEGKLSERANKNAHHGEYRHVVEGFNKTLDAIYSPFRETIKILQQLASRDLTARMNSDCHGDYQTIKENINAVASALDEAISQVSEAVRATASAANQISSSTEEMAAGAHEQASQASEVSGAVEEMTKTIYETTKNTTAASEASRFAGESARVGGKVVAKTIEGMDRIAEVVKQSADTVMELGRSSDQIGEIVQVINDIADQTNLLALNAAIEAARAGEQGRGFAVVADEVRKLAERTTKATKEIASMIKQIQKDTSGAVESMQRGTAEVEKGKSLAHKAGDSLKEIITGADKVSDIISQVATASEEQSGAAEHISKNIEAISSVTAQSASGIQQIAHASEDLNRLTLNLQELIAQFKVDETSGKGNLAVRQNGKLVHA
ncbi:MAG: HAMP domain-containing protein [Ignavibacteriales bacterium]|nr:HAMP domain-containing protein [Ignavibacteriales bacterium]